MNEDNREFSDMAAVIEAMKELHQAELIDIDRQDGHSYLVVPKGMQAIDVQAVIDARIDRRALAPRRCKGDVAVDTLDAFLDVVRRFCGAQTVVYVHDGSKPQLVAVLNDSSDASNPGWRDHRIVYVPALSDEWQAWSDQDSKGLSQVAFAELLEDRCLDVISPASVGPKTKGILEQLGVKAASPAELQGLARGLSIRVDSTVKEVRSLDSGEAQVVYSEQHTGEDGKPLNVPRAFVIAIPVFKGGAAYTHAVRLRYRASQGRVVWSYSVIHADQAKRDAVVDMMTTVREKLPEVLVVEGQP